MKKNESQDEGLFKPFSNLRFMNNAENHLIMEDSTGNKVEILFRPGCFKQAMDLGHKELAKNFK